MYMMWLPICLFLFFLFYISLLRNFYLFLYQCHIYCKRVSINILKKEFIEWGIYLKSEDKRCFKKAKKKEVSVFVVRSSRTLHKAVLLFFFFTSNNVFEQCYWNKSLINIMIWVSYIFFLFSRGGGGFKVKFMPKLAIYFKDLSIYLHV